ncbi:MMPL family transporter [Stratiformator vulcanicus]|uniref:Membrane transport protein mmpL8 n=1 Tax=Stratiformator vulcanicus TaxID=2527980 RepID=A0A517R578_9PLAN|nr:MMPL family transporter [Stratiformator vulcanicus]QDT39000.1 Membrane transport protein mmpL8 [Stratiformator vulcanicus]
MFFHSLGRLVSRSWAVLPVLWVALLCSLYIIAPPFQSVVEDGEFDFLPESSPSLVAEEAFNSAFSSEFARSSIAVVVRRKGVDDEGQPQELTTAEDLTERPELADYTFIDNVLIPRIRELVISRGWMAPAGEEEQTASDGDAQLAAVEETIETDIPTVVTDIGESPDGSINPIVANIRTYQDSGLGELLQSQDGSAALIVLNLETEYQEKVNQPLINALAELVDPATGDLRAEGKIPPGLEIYLSGPAVVGNDLRQAAQDSARATDSATAILVIGLLLIIYRAPLLAIIPLLTVFVAVKTSLLLLALAAQAGWVDLFNGIKIYVSVVMYGAGIDYCMFLMARYREELEEGGDFGSAIGAAIGNVGPALAASAGTTMVGLGMMYFAQFGKFSEAGVAMSFSLGVVLIGTLTLTPALLRMFGRYAFWPHVPRERITRAANWLSPTNIISRLLERSQLRKAWSVAADRIAAAPLKWLVVTIAVMTPFAAVGVAWHDWLTYGLLSELPPSEISVRGAEAVSDHFPAGYATPTTLLISQPENPDIDFSDPEGAAVIDELTDSIWQRREELGISDLRTVTAPLGVERLEGLNAFQRRAAILRAQRFSDYYVGSVDSEQAYATRIDLIFEDDPFSRDSIRKIEELRQLVPEILPESLTDSQIHFLGATASIRDLREVTAQDQVLIDLLVLAGVFTVLVILLRNAAISAFLITTVFFSYLVTFGVTFCVFAALTPDFVGLDWKVPVFLFVILVAVGEDYNIYLVTRVEEEQQRHGPVAGVTSALAKTGGIISGCGMIMAGTFSSLMFGSLSGMIQLGFALAFGVLLDTFVVRPIIVPAYLVMLNRGDFGSLGPWLGAFQPKADGSDDVGVDLPESESNASPIDDTEQSVEKRSKAS